MVVFLRSFPIRFQNSNFYQFLNIEKYKGREGQKKKSLFFINFHLFPFTCHVLLQRPVTRKSQVKFGREDEFVWERIKIF